MGLGTRGGERGALGGEAEPRRSAPVTSSLIGFGVRRRAGLKAAAADRRSGETALRESFCGLGLLYITQKPEALTPKSIRGGRARRHDCSYQRPPKPAPSRSGSIREFPSLSPRFPRKNQLFPSRPFRAPRGFGHSPSRGVSPRPQLFNRLCITGEIGAGGVRVLSKK